MSSPEPSAVTGPGSDPAARMRWVEALFHRAIECPAGERTAMIRAWCGTDEELFAEVHELLEADSSVQQKIASASTTGGGSPHPADPDGSDQWLGQVLRGYRLEKELGRGGMGVVYLGVRAVQDGSGGKHGLHTEVAVKVVRRNLRSSPAQQHFLVERDVLARLEHPNIARLLDGGVTAEGAPYLVLEFVPGQRLDSYCDAPGVTAEEVVRLMIQLCGAVGYVHRNLILHRDLKPGNVMVTAEGTVKLLDFGTLKVLAAEEQLSAMTQAGMRPVTLRYASPEHLFGQRVTTATDVYSLGMTLYRLIAGRFPESNSGDGHSSASHPSALMALMMDDLKQGRLKPPSALATRPMPKELGRDLDAIIARAMRYEPEQRYASADALAADLTRALEHRPVEARGADTRYRLGKFYQRNTASIWAGVAAAVVLALGTAGMAREARIARQEQQRAEAGVEQERKLAHLLLFDYFVQLQQIPGSTDAQRQAVTQAVRYLDGLTATAPSPAVTLESVRAYTAMGTLLGSPYYQNLGDPPGAIETLKKALPPAEALVRQRPHDADALQALAGVQLVLGQVYMGSGEPKVALDYLKASSTASLELANRPDADVRTLFAAGTVLGLMGDDYSQRGSGTMRDTAKARAIYLQMLGINERIHKMEPGNGRSVRGIALALTKLGQLSEEEDVDKAMDYYRQGLAALDSLSPVDRVKVPAVRSYGILRLSTTSCDIYTGRKAEALALAAVERQRSLSEIAADPLDARARFDLEAIDSTLGDAYLFVKDYPNALTYTGNSLESARVLVRLQPKNATYQYLYAFALLRHGKALKLNGQTEAGLRESTQGMDLLLPIASAPDAEPDALGSAADALIDLHRDPAKDGPLAVAFARRAMAGSGSPSSDQLLGLAEAQRFAGDAVGSKQSAQAALTILEKTPRGLGHQQNIAQAKSLIAETSH